MLRTRFALPALLVLLAMSVLPLYGAGNGGGTGAPPSAEAEFVTAPVEIDGQVLFRVRGSSSYPAEQRAAAIRDRIEAAAADKTIHSDMLRSVDADNVTTILAGERPLMIVGDADARLEHLSRDYLAKTHLARIRQAIDDYRRMRSREALLHGCLYTGGATIALIVCVALIIRLGRWLDRFVTERVESRIHSLGFQSFEIVRAEHLRRALHGMPYALRIAAILTVSFVYLNFVLVLFPWTKGLASRLLDLVTDPLISLGKSFTAKIPHLIVLAIIFFLFRFALRLIHLFFDAIAQERVKLSGFDAEWAFPTYKIVRLAVIVFGLVVAYPYIPGSESPAFKGISIFMGVLFSLGSSSMISNILAGYMMTYRRVFKIGDRVKIGDVMGDVTAIRLQVTHLRTPKNEEVSIPNSQILSGNVVNYSSLARAQGLILHTTVGIGYETPWRQVEAMLLMAAERTPGLLREPQPFIIQKELGDFAVSYELNVYCDDPHEMNRLYTELHRRILDVFNEYGVQIMTPAYESDAAEPKVVPPEQWYAPPAQKAE